MINRIQKYFSRPLDRLPLSGIGAEIGVFKAAHATALLQCHSAITMLYCIDPYVDYDPVQETGLTQAQKIATRRLSRFRNRVTIVRNTTKCVQLPQLNFACIDGDHRYPAVREDIESIWPQIKPGGVIGGHDFHFTWPGVIRAVTEFSVKQGLIVMVETPDWWILK